VAAARAAVVGYCLTLREGLRAYPWARPLLRRCAVCRLFFLIDPRAAWHECVCCPYGCRLIRQRERSDKRVKAYYQTREGRLKKAAHNRTRSLKEAAPAAQAPAPPTEDAGPSPAIITHLQIVTSLFEGRPVGREEIVALLARNVRQHMIGRLPLKAYVRSRSKMTSRGS
jgi:hypothetical protein